MANCDGGLWQRLKLCRTKPNTPCFLKRQTSEADEARDRGAENPSMLVVDFNAVYAACKQPAALTTMRPEGVSHSASIVI
jgi:hypothetical protein